MLKTISLPRQARDNYWQNSRQNLNVSSQAPSSCASSSSTFCCRSRCQVKKRHFLSHLYIKMMILPRQARDKHRETTQKSPFCRCQTSSSDRSTSQTCCPRRTCSVQIQAGIGRPFFFSNENRFWSVLSHVCQSISYWSPFFVVRSRYYWRSIKMIGKQGLLIGAAENDALLVALFGRPFWSPFLVALFGRPFCEAVSSTAENLNISQDRLGTDIGKS